MISMMPVRFFSLQPKFQESTFFRSPLLRYCITFLLFAVADAVMAYTVPYYLENALPNYFSMGVLLASSSIAGILFDIILNKYLNKQSFLFFLKFAFTAALIFPLTFLILPPIIPIFLLSMTIWGIYYELISFSHFHFIHLTDRRKHAQSWGIISIFKSSAYVIGPLLAGSLYAISGKLPFLAAILLILVGFLFLIAYQKTLKGKPGELSGLGIKTKLDFGQELHNLKQIMSKVWPIWLFNFAIFLVDAAFWSIGVLFAQEGDFKGLLLSAYMLPSLFVGLSADKASRPFGKKRIALLAGLIAGTLIVLMGFLSANLVLLTVVFLSSIFGALACNEIIASFEDYFSRLRDLGDEMVTIERTSENLAYIIGPVIGGLLASILGFQKTFSVFGGFLVFTAILAFVALPRKIKMPQTKLFH